MNIGNTNTQNIKVDIVKIVDGIFKDAVDANASDIHIEPTSTGMMLRHRVDGALKVVSQGDKIVNGYIVARIKIMAGIETTGKPRPLEGNIKFTLGDNWVDLRVSIFPTNYGESVVIRILESNKFFDDFSELGFFDDQVNILNEVIKRPYGLVLVTGPNGSGKSTTLFTMLNRLNKPQKSLVTLEDPIERKIERVRQTNIDPNINLTFANGLRYLLRQDPDVIMVGEIRDKETAQIAVQAAITGHLVLATIHTNNAAGAIVRLLNMGIEPFLLSSALKFVSAQRLARVNCEACKETYEPPKQLLERLNAPQSIKFYHSLGCDKCNQDGVFGRQGVHEILTITKTIKNLILEKPTDEQINKVAIKEEDMTMLKQAALQKVYEGTISIEEAIRLAE
ncbi:MAG: GspE/PulE family protein [Patescibacteria group bacterium]|nr:GspE/PulE family protein [Patescibacteria group bacterium]